MRTYKLATICSALAGGLLLAGTAFAAQPAFEPVLVTGQDMSASALGPITSVQVRKVYFFTQLDKDHNQRLSRAELPSDMHDLRRNFVRADFNQDGQLSAQECLLYAQGQAPEYTGVAHAYTYVYSSASSLDDRNGIVNAM